MKKAIKNKKKDLQHTKAYDTIKKLFREK